ncbi:hypothetical protein GGR52DRAFT_572286 [Hypoxylon sp. FL1284]|nr:hypothetical protein GGR52DRAFT_572286 [Hypoxylon sp. FL1284]
MGNVCGSRRVFYIGCGWGRPGGDGSSSDNTTASNSTSSGESGEPYGWPQLLAEMFCGCGASGDDSSAVVVGMRRRKGCRIRDHWALAFRPGVDVAQLPPRIAGYRTRIPERCRRRCR